MGNEYEEIKGLRTGTPKEKVVFQEDVKLLNIKKGQEFPVKINTDGYKFINIGRMNLYLTEQRNMTGVYKRFRLKEGA